MVEVPKVIRVLFVDDEVRLRRAWEKLFSSRTDMVLVGTLAQADGLVGAATELSPDIAVVDLTMPGIDPLKAIAELAAARPDVRAVVYSGQSDPQLLQAALDAGAWGYIDKLTAPATMFTVLQRVADGEVVFPAWLNGQRA